MKFGKRLRDLLEDSLPEWKNKFLSYKDLKKRLKGLPVGDTATENGVATFVPDVQNGDTEVPTSEEEFIDLLNTELEKFNNFFMEKEEEFVIRMQVLRDDIERMKGQCEMGDLAHCTDCAAKAGELRKAIVSLHGEMVLLENYSALNYTGLVKILKKHDKRTGLLLRHPFISNVLRQPFLTTEILSKLVKECEQRIQAMFPSYSSAGSQVDDRSAAGSPSRHREERDSSPDSPTAVASSVNASAFAAFAHLPETTGDDDVEAVYRSALTALRSLQEIRGSSKTPHPLLADAASLPVVSFQKVIDTESGARCTQGAVNRAGGSVCSSYGDAGSCEPAAGAGNGDQGQGAGTAPDHGSAGKSAHATPREGDGVAGQGEGKGPANSAGTDGPHGARSEEVKPSPSGALHDGSGIPARARASEIRLGEGDEDASATKRLKC